MKLNIKKKSDQNKWKRVFTLLPKKTLDGYVVFFGFVWRRTKILNDTHDLLLDSRYVTEYHTNPDNLETDYIQTQQKQVTGDNSTSIQVRGNVVINDSRTRKLPPAPPVTPSNQHKHNNIDIVNVDQYIKHLKKE